VTESEATDFLATKHHKKRSISIYPTLNDPYPYSTTDKPLVIRRSETIEEPH
jgi:hypothetical protein